MVFITIHKQPILGVIETNTIQQHKRHFDWALFIIGCIALVIATGLAIWAFSKDCLNNYQGLILLWAFPIASGFAAGSFTGSLKIPEKATNGLPVGAVGGFAVWLLTFFFWLPSGASVSSCGNLQKLQVTKFDFLVESNYVSKDVNSVLTKLEKRSNRDFDITKPSDLRVAFGLVIEGFKVQDIRKTKIRINTAILDQEGRVLASDDVETFDSISEWRSMPNVVSVGEEAVYKLTGLSSADTTDTTNSQYMPTIILLEDFSENEIPKQRGSIRVTVIDELSEEKVVREERIDINWK